jgi:hypothetical protein
MARVYQFFISLRESDPLIWRRFQVPSSIRLPRLHRVLQIIMGWENYHLHQFQHRGTIYGIPDPEWPAPERFRDESDILLGRLITSPGDSLSYEYDFGDSWEHDVILEAITQPEVAIQYPICFAGARACPPEDVGGLSGYDHYLKAIADPQHEEHQEMIDWRGEGFDPVAFNLAAVNSRLHQRSRRLRASPA